MRITSLDIDFHSGRGIVDSVEDTLLISADIKSKYSSEECFNSDLGYIYWKIVHPECTDQVSKAIVFKGTGTLVTEWERGTRTQVLQVSHDGYDLLVKGEEMYVCGFKSSLTEHPGLFVTILQGNSKVFFLKKQIVPSPVGEHPDSKMVYSRHTTPSGKPLSLIRTKKM